MRYLKEFFLLNLSEYKNMELVFPIGAVITILTVLMIGASIYYYYYKSYTATLIRALERHEAYDEGSAVTLKVLRLDSSRSIRRALVRGGKLTSIVRQAGKKPQSYEEYVESLKDKKLKKEKTDFSNARFYIDAEKRDIARSQIVTRPSILTPVVSCAVIIIIFVLLLIFLPSILSLLDEAMK